LIQVFIFIVSGIHNFSYFSDISESESSGAAAAPWRQKEGIAEGGSPRRKAEHHCTARMRVRNAGMKDAVLLPTGAERGLAAC
jgi:hypothetical protein